MTNRRHLTTRLIVVAVAPMLLLTGGVTVPVASAAATSETGHARAGFSTCRQLNAEYPHGVSSKDRGRKWWVRRGATGVGLHCPRVYRQVKAKLDRDGDKIACER